MQLHKSLPSTLSHLLARSPALLQVSLYGLLLGVLFSSSLLTAEPQAVANELNTSAMRVGDAWGYRVTENDELWLAYYDATRALWVRHPNGNVQRLGADDRRQAPSGLGLAQVEDGLAVLWRDKLPEKGLFLWQSASSDARPKNIDDETQALGRIAALPTKDHLHTFWYGERPDPTTGLTYYIYHRKVPLEDGPSSSIDTVLPGIYPVAATSKSGDIMVPSWTVGEEQPAIAVRFLLNGETEFGPRIDVANNVQITPLLRAFTSKDRWFVVWHEQHTELSEKPFSLHVAYTSDLGKTWHRYQFDQLNGFDIGTADLAVDEKGRILIAVDALDRRSASRHTARHSIWLLRSDDNGATWNAADLRSQNGLSRFQARNPSVIFGPGPDDVLVAWQDTRDIRPRLYGSFSSDGGKTWRVNGAELPNMPTGNLGLRFDVSSLYVADEAFNLVGEQYEDTFRTKSLFHASFTIKDLLNAADATSSELTPDARTDRLKKRVRDFWHAMQEDNYRLAYTFYDPFFRALNSEQRYVSLTGRIAYSDFELGQIKVDGPLALVTATVIGDIVPFRAPTTGELIDRDPKRIPINDTWLWLDGDWYREFYSETQDLKYTRY